MVSIAVIKNHGQKQVQEEVAYFILQLVVHQEGFQGRNTRQELKAAVDAEAMEEW